MWHYITLTTSLTVITGLTNLIRHLYSLESRISRKALLQMHVKPHNYWIHMSVPTRAMNSSVKCHVHRMPMGNAILYLSTLHSEMYDTSHDLFSLITVWMLSAGGHASGHFRQSHEIHSTKIIILIASMTCLYKDWIFCFLVSSKNFSLAWIKLALLFFICSYEPRHAKKSPKALVKRKEG